jgi:hypothetical protein
MAGCEVRPERTVLSVNGLDAGIELTIDGDINDICTSLGTGEHTANGDTGSVVRVDVNGKVRVGLSDSANEPELLAQSL